MGLFWWIVGGVGLAVAVALVCQFAPLMVGAVRSWNLYRKGLSRYRAGDVDGAEESWRQAVEASFMNVSARLGLGRLLADRDDPEGALEQYREALRVKPGYAKAHMNMANVLLDLGRHDDALASYETAASVGIVRAHKMMGSIHQHYKHDRTRALEAYARYLTAVGGSDPEVEAWIRNLTGKD